MSNLTKSLAYIKSSIDSGLSIWDSLTRLMLNVIREKSLTEVSSEFFCKEFTDYYQINIPIHPMNTIIGKLKQSGVLDDEYGKWTINISKIDEISIQTQNQEIFENLLQELKKYLYAKFGIDKDIDSTEKIFFGYINIYDSELLFSLETKSMLPEITISNKEIYMVSSFIEWILKEKPLYTKILQDILLANIHLNSVFFIEKNRKIKLQKVFVYLDTRFILRLTGIEGDFRKDEYSSLLDILINNNCNLRMFDVHYNEVVNIINDCKNWLVDKKKYNQKFASRALRYFVEHNYNISDILSYQAKLDVIIKNYKIGIDTHNYEEDKLNKYNIDEENLFAIIKELYGENENHFENYGKDEMIWNDIKAISAIYRKRKRFYANSLRNVKAIFITNNRTLAKAVREYNKNSGRTEKYSECVTETYWGTAIWLNTAYKEDTFYTKKLIADSIALTELNPKLKQRYLKNISEKKENGDFSDEEYYVLREHSGISQFLKDATFNDEEEYDDSLPEEMLERFKNEINKPFQEKIESNNEEIAKKDNALFVHQQRVEKQLSRIDIMAKRFSSTILVGCGFLLNIPSFLLTFQDLIQNQFLSWGIRIVSVGIGVFFCIDGFTRFAIGKKLYDYKRKSLKIKWGISD